MDYTTLGRTGLRVSVAGLGCGGFSRLGLGTGHSEAEAIAVVREALDQGVNFIDTAANYGTEGVVGAALDGVPRDGVIIATKASAHRGTEGRTAEDVVASLDNSLRALRTDCIDVFQLHGVPPALYDHARDAVAPALLRERERGKIRYLGITENSANDHRQEMLARAAPDGLWDVMMVAFHMMHQPARETLFPVTRQAGIGTLLMFAVRSIFSRPERLREVLDELAESGALKLSGDPLGFLVEGGGAETIPDAAYRFVRHEPGVDVVLFGTGDRAHVRSNVASILKPDLPEADRARIIREFGHLAGIGLDSPAPAKRR